MKISEKSGQNDRRRFWGPAPDSGIMNDLDHSFMRIALQEAEKALSEGEIAVGAALVHGDTLLWADHNRREQLHDPTAHAEILCLRNGAKAFGDWRLSDCTLYVTLEPCPMCADMGCCGSVYDLPADSALHAGTRWEQGGPEEECRALLKQSFSRLRP